MAAGQFNPHLRYALLLNYIPGLALCTASAAVTNCVLPGIGIIPLTLSLVSSLLFLYIRRFSKNSFNDDSHFEGRIQLGVTGKRSQLESPCLFLFLDAVSAAGFITVLLCTWIIPNYYWYDGDDAFLAAYATVPLLASFFIHAWLVGVGFKNGIKAFRQRQTTTTRECPNCHVRFHGTTGHVALPQVEETRSLTPQTEEERPMFRDTSFDGDAAIRPSDEVQNNTKSP